MKYYFLSWKNSSKRGPVAYNSAKVGTSVDTMKKIVNDTVLYFDFDIKDVLETKTGLVVNNPMASHQYEWLDYMPNDLAWPLMSEKMKSIVESSLIEKDYISWISTNVILFEVQRKYYVLKFTKKLDVLDIENTIFVRGTDAIIRPAFSREKIAKYSIFGEPLSQDLWRITHGLYVSETLKKSLQKEKCTGLDFSNTIVE